MASQSRVFSAYRRLFRARRQLFGGDVEALRESRVAMRAEFDKQKAAPTSGEGFEGLLTMVDEAVDMLRHGIVRGNLNAASGNYGRCL
jgi:complex III assembly factor LYRM7